MAYEVNKNRGLMDIWGNSDLGDVGNLFGGIGEFGTGLYQMFMGNKMFKLQEQTLDEQIAASKRGFNAMATQQRNNVSRYNGYNGNKVNDKEIVKNV